MTTREAYQLTGVLSTLSDWMLKVIRDNPKSVTMFASNELAIRKVKSTHVETINKPT